MRRWVGGYLGVLGLVAVGALAAPAQAQDRVLVFAAASLGTALDEIATTYAAATGDEIVVAVAGSAALARQIQFGAPADIFISAHPEWMDLLQSQGLIVADSRADLLSNRLVVIAPGVGDGTPPPPLAGFDLPARLGDARLAIALTEAVPAGQYARAALEHLGIWEALVPRLAETDNVRSALALVALGEAPFGIVYETDARAEPRVHIAATIPAASHPPIRYPVAVVTDRDRPEVRQVQDFLTGPSARAVFDAHGFLPAPGSAARSAPPPEAAP